MQAQRAGGREAEDKKNMTEMASLIFLIRGLLYETQHLKEGKMLGVIIRIIAFSVLFIKCNIPEGHLGVSPYGACWFFFFFSIRKN